MRGILEAIHTNRDRDAICLLMDLKMDQSSDFVFMGLKYLKDDSKDVIVVAQKTIVDDLWA